LIWFQANPSLLSISTPKEIQELDVGILLDMESWKFEDQFEFDLLNLYKFVIPSFGIV